MHYDTRASLRVSAGEQRETGVIPKTVGHCKWGVASKNHWMHTSGNGGCSYSEI
jgi:hypothetical protein